MKRKTKENPALKERVISGGRYALYLEYYLGSTREPITNEAGEAVLYTSGKMQGTPKYKVHHIRRKENLGIYVPINPKTTKERAEKNENYRIAEALKLERQKEFLEDSKGIVFKNKKENILLLMDEYLEEYNKKGVRTIKSAINVFKRFLSNTPKYSLYTTHLQPNQITKDMIRDFVEYIQEHHRGEGALSVYKRFRQVIKHLIEHDILIKNPCSGITITADTETIKKDILSQEEVNLLLATEYKGQNEELRRAVEFALYTGLRYCDIRDITYRAIDYSNRTLTIQQAKTGGFVIQYLTDRQIEIIGKPKNNNKDQNIFNIPTHNGCTHSLKTWCKKAGIEKHITWHSLRHTFGTLLSNNPKLSTKEIATLMGHTTTKYTERYMRASNERMRAGIEELQKRIGK